MTEPESWPSALPATTVPRPGRSVRSGVLEFFSRKDQLTAAKHEAYCDRDPGFRDFALARLALKDARQLANSSAGRDTALLLYRDVVRLLVRATVLRKTNPDDLTSTELRASALRLPAWPADGEFPRLDELVFGEHGDAMLAGLLSGERERTLVILQGVATQLAGPLEAEASRVSRLRRSRALRIGSVALLLLVALSWGISSSRIRPKNLALNHPVFVMHSDPGFGVDSRKVVDGDELNLGFHTASVPRTSVTIDLGRVNRITVVDVFNRSECCQERATPLLLQLSTDNSTFKTVARRTRMFQRWTISLPPGTEARFVRLFHEGSDYFHLAEVKVF